MRSGSPPRRMLIAGGAALVSTVALSAVAWSGADASAAAARAAIREQARVEARAAAARVSTELAAGADRAFAALLTVGPEGLPAAWGARRDWPAPVAEALLVDPAGRVVWPRPSAPLRPAWVEERPGDADARERLRRGALAEFRDRDPAAAAALYAQALDPRFGCTVRLEALLPLAALEARTGDAARAAELYETLLDPARFPARFVDGRTRLLAHIEGARARLAAGDPARAADGFRQAVEDLDGEAPALEAGAARLFRERLRALVPGLAGALPDRAAELAAASRRLADPPTPASSPEAGLAEWLAPRLAGRLAPAARAFAQRRGGVPLLASARAVPAEAGPWTAAFRWSDPAWRAAVGRVLPAPAGAPAALRLCDAAGTDLLGAGASDAEPAALVPVEGVDGWLVAAELRDAAAIESGLRAQQWALAGAAVGLLAVSVAALVLLVRAARQEAELAALKGEFVAHVSHELKTPVSVIRMYAETLALGRVAGEEQRAEYVRTIARESERLSAMIDNILDFSRIDQGRRTYRIERTELGPLLAEVVAAHRERFAREGFRVELHFDAPPAVAADRGALVSALSNLLDNAAKYSDGDKVIEVRASARDGGAEVEVADRGIGVPVGERERIFDAFARGADERVRTRKGSGLGLALVKHAIAAHGGRVWATAREGGGSVFHVFLPAAPDRPPSSADRAGQHHGG